MYTIELKADAVTDALGRAAALLEDMTPLMTDIGEILVFSTKARFPLGQAPDGSKWAANSPVTLARKTDSRPLFGPTGLLSQQIFSIPGTNQVEVGSNRIYAAMMQFGGTKAQFPNLWGNIPARPFLGISDEDETHILDAVGEYLGAAFTGP